MTSKYIGVADNLNREAQLPRIKLIPKSIDSDYFLNIINSDLYHRGRVLQYANKKRKVISPGEYYYFEGQVVIEDV